MQSLLMEQKEVMHSSDDVFFDDCPTLGEKEANETISPGAFSLGAEQIAYFTSCLEKG
jgi:hypothetical protein